MAKTLWNINFSTLNTTNELAAGKAAKYTHSDNLTDGVYKADGQGTTPSPSINAVNIDWNGATWAGITESLPSTINTTADLLKVIKYASTLPRPVSVYGTLGTKQRLEHSKWCAA